MGVHKALSHYGCSREPLMIVINKTTLQAQMHKGQARRASVLKEYRCYLLYLPRVLGKAGERLALQRTCLSPISSPSARIIPVSPGFPNRPHPSFSLAEARSAFGAGAPFLRRSTIPANLGCRSSSPRTCRGRRQPDNNDYIGTGSKEEPHTITFCS